HPDPSRRPTLSCTHTTRGDIAASEYDQAGRINPAPQLIHAGSPSKAPHISLITGASYGAGHYGMSGRAFNPRFVFSWPSALSAVMGAEQLASVVSSVAAASARARNSPMSAEAEQHMFNEIRDQIDAESLPEFLSGMVYDDGIIDPRATRSVLGLALSAIHSGPVQGADGFGVFRM